jgi:hypothetical protein
MERAGGDEQNVVGAHHAVARVHRGAFHDGQNVALHAFARNIGPMAALAAGDLVDLVEEDDAARFHALRGGAVHRVHVDQAAFFFLHQVVERVAHLHLALLVPPPKMLGSMSLRFISMSSRFWFEMMPNCGFPRSRTSSSTCDRRACPRGTAGAAFHATADSSPCRAA